MLLLRIESCSDIDGLLLLFRLLCLVWLRKKLIFKDPLEQARTLIVRRIVPFSSFEVVVLLWGGRRTMEELNDIICKLRQDETRKILKPLLHNEKGRYCCIIFIHQISNAETRVDVCWVWWNILRGWQTENAILYYLVILPRQYFAC